MIKRSNDFFVAGERAATPKASSNVPVISPEQVAARAYEIWQTRGCPPGDDAQNWIEAEEQLRAELVKAKSQRRRK